MRKSDLVLKMAERYPDLDRKQLRLAVDVIFEEIASALGRGDHVELPAETECTIECQEPKPVERPAA